jgi:peptidoglycan/xylan/chitin deacetylase (PgdA/CDA1 family)
MGIGWKEKEEELVPASQSTLLEEGSRVALTFDDGPDPSCTETLLDGLKKRKVKASFFLIGENIPGNENLVRRMHEEGHLVGNHTYSHVQLPLLSEEEAYREIVSTGNLIYQITGEYPSFVRPPYGEWKEGMEFIVTMIPVNWTVDPLDWEVKDADLVVSRVESQVKNEDIILLHDCYESSVQAALRIIDDLTSRGYEFVTIDRLLFR